MISRERKPLARAEHDVTKHEIGMNETAEPLKLSMEDELCT